MAQEEADALLMQLAQQAGGIEPLLHGVFSFLKRKTDFYHIQREGDRIGFPPGKAKQLVIEAYERFESDDACPPPPKDDLEQRGERLLPDGRRGPPAAPGQSCALIELHCFPATHFCPTLHVLSATREVLAQRCN